MSSPRSNAVARAVAVGLLAWLGGAALGIGYHSTGGRDGFDSWRERVLQDPFRNGGALFWGGGLALWMLCTAALRGGTLGGVAAAVAVLGSGVACTNLISLGNHGRVDATSMIVGVVVWSAGVAGMAFARASREK